MSHKNWTTITWGTKANFHHIFTPYLKLLPFPQNKGDILVRSEGKGNSSLLFPHSIVADPDRLWPDATVTYRFWKTFPKSESLLFL